MSIDFSDDIAHLRVLEYALSRGDISDVPSSVETQLPGGFKVLPGRSPKEHAEFLIREVLPSTLHLQSVVREVNARRANRSLSDDLGLSDRNSAIPGYSSLANQLGSNEAFEHYINDRAWANMILSVFDPGWRWFWIPTILFWGAIIIWLMIEGFLRYGF